jgi:uncharacterized membrane protein YhaH (DUF805 family)
MDRSATFDLSRLAVLHDFISQGDAARFVLELKDIVYYLSLTALALFLGTVSIEVRRWR